MLNDEDFLLQALQLAYTRRGFCAPNPAVGSVIVNDQGQIIGKGYHHGPGFPHAEVEALQSVQTQAAGHTLYVTLEPCCHFGRTPPCTQAILKAGIKRVVYAYQDPNPIVSGKGAVWLRANGVLCEHKPLSVIDEFYRSYRYWQLHRQPYLTAKIAMSLDGKIAGPQGQRIQLTSPTLQQFTHQQRLYSDAILTTAQTIIQDNPQLNVRDDKGVIAKPLYIIDRQLLTPLHAQIFETAKSITIFHSRNYSIASLQALLKRGVRCVAVDETKQGLCLDHVLSQLGQDGLHDVWVEAGSRFFTALLQAKLAQRFFIYMAPVWLHQGLAAITAPFSFDAYRIHWKIQGNEVVGEFSLANEHNFLIE